MFLPRTQDTVNTNLRDRIRNLERGTPGNDRPLREEVIEFGQSGTVTTGISDPKLVVWGGQVIAVALVAGTAGAGASTFRIRVGGTITGNTITLDASDTSTIGYVGDHRIPNGSVLAFEVVTVGAGLAGLNAYVRMKG